MWTFRRKRSNIELAFKSWSIDINVRRFYSSSSSCMSQSSTIMKKRLCIQIYFIEFRRLMLWKRWKFNVVWVFERRKFVSIIWNRNWKKRVNKFENDIDKRSLFKQIRITVILKSQFVTAFLSIRMISSWIQLLWKNKCDKRCEKFSLTLNIKYLNQSHTIVIHWIANLIWIK